VNFAQAFVSELVGFVGYALIFAAVWKLSQIKTELGEIKQLLKRNGPLAASGSSDDASDYAQNLLRSIASETASAEK